MFQGAEFLGQDSFSPPPYSRIIVGGAFVRLNKQGTIAAVADFSVRPPVSICFDGETDPFYP